MRPAPREHWRGQRAGLAVLLGSVALVPERLPAWSWRSLAEDERRGR
ncbi:MAG: hypothetical protein KKA73_15040 [Chloroflexi bacterium]|nr:hypothetical protein [Chloroflexota bacterium]